MKRLVSCLLGLGMIASAAFAGTDYSGKEMKQVAAPPPCPEWYADNEFNVSLWSTYIFTGNNWQDDRYLEADHAWGGGVDLKYFFHRYFGVGIEAYGLAVHRDAPEVSVLIGTDGRLVTLHDEDKAVGSVLGTFTLRYP